MSKQATYRSVRKNRFTQISNDLLWDGKISLQAKGLLSIFLSNAVDWDINMKEIIQRSKNGRDAHYKTINELILNGYFARVEVKRKTPNGNVFENMEYIFSDNKSDIENELEHIKINAANENKQVSIEYKDQSDKKKKTASKGKKTSYTENQDTRKTSHTENQDTRNAYTRNAYTENQYINNTKGNNTKSNNTKGNNKNLSIYEEIQQLDVPLSIKKQLHINSDRLTDDNISLGDIKIVFNSYQSKISEYEFVLILSNVLEKTEGHIRRFKDVMSKSIQNYLKQSQQEDIDKYEGDKKKTNEVIPHWFKKNNDQQEKETDQPEHKQQPIIDLEKEKRELREFLNAANDNN